MNRIEFKNLFDSVAKVNGFKKLFGGWYKETPECICVLELQKSNFGDYYQLLIKIFIQQAFNKTYIPNKELMKSSLGHVDAREPPEYRSVFDFDEFVDDEIRRNLLEKLFREYIVPFTDRVLTRSGVRELSSKGEVFLLPAVKKEIDRLG